MQYIKLLEENTEKNLHDLGLQKLVSGMKPNAKAIKGIECHQI